MVDSVIEIGCVVTKGENHYVHAHCVYMRAVYLYITMLLQCTSLQGLTQVEEMLISAVMPIMSIYRLPHGQYSYSGHVINLPQNIASFATSLPRLPSDLDVVIVRKEGANQSHRDFQVRRQVVHRALQWLLTHNIYYMPVIHTLTRKL